MPPVQPPSPDSSQRPRPTIADIPLAPRRRLRDGSRSSSSSTGTGSGARRSRSRSAQNTVVPTISIASSTRGRVAGRTAREDTGGNSRGRGTPLEPVVIGESSDENQGEREETESSQGSIVAISPQLANGRSRLPPHAASVDLPDTHHDRSVNTASHTTITAASPRPVFSPPSVERYSRRYTAKEKGKGRAEPIAIEISSDEGSDVEPIGGQMRVIKGIRTRTLAPGANVARDKPKFDQESMLGTGYSCPICFNAPSPAVLTLCGHIMCAGCLHSSLIAAIRRKPNPHPDHGAAANRAPPSRGRGRPRRGAANHHDGQPASTPITPPSEQPAHWTVAGLHQIWSASTRDRIAKSLIAQNWPKEDMDATVAMMLENEGGLGPDYGAGSGFGGGVVEVREMLSGLWKVGQGWVVEGDCPVCRKPLPGGYGPPDSGIGGIVPLEGKLSI